jgi:ribulose-bisphosphate carboxylase large chain
MPRKNGYSSCDIPAECGKKTLNRNRKYSFQEGFTWKGVKVESYKPEGSDWSNIIRQVMIGSGGESTKFHLRYFEISPGGYSSFEIHGHEHVVIGIRGKGKAQISRRNFEVTFLDVLYIKPHAPHRLYNPYHEPFGFFCIVNAKRDRPKPVRVLKSKCKV